MNTLTRTFGALTLLVLIPCAGAEALTLEQVVRLAQTRNERVGAARADLAAADARVSRARSFFFPDLTLNGTYTRRSFESVREIGGEQVTIQSRDGLNGTAVVSAPIFDARAFPLLRQARHERDAVALSAGDVERVIGFEAAVAFLQTLGAEQLSAAAERRLDYAQANLIDARARFEAGLVSSNDVTRAELEVANAELALSRARTSAESARIALEDLIAAPIEGELVPPTDILVVARTTTPDETALINTASEMRLDLRAASARVRALEAFADEPSRRFIPRLGFVGQYRATNEGGISGRDEDATAAVNLTWPLFDGGDARAERLERNAVVRAQQLELELAERNAVNQIRTAISRLQSEQVSIRSAGTAVEAAQRNATETNILYREGLATSLELADAGVQLFEAEAEQVRALYDVAIAWLDMRSAAGLPPVGDATPAQESPSGESGAEE